MAGQGFKVFAAGAVLTAAEINEYLATQIVGQYDNVADRLAQIPSPGEGQMSYLKDTDSVEAYSGSAWIAVGGSAGGFENSFLLMGA